MLPFIQPTGGYSQSEMLIKIEHYVNAVSNRGGTFPPSWRARERRAYCDEVLRELPKLLWFYVPEHEYSEHIEAFWHACEKLGFLNCGQPTWMVRQLTLPGVDSLAVVRELEERIAEYTTTLRFRRRASDRRYEQRMASERLEAYSRFLIAQYARSLVLRVDLAYLKDAKPTIAEVYRDLDRLLALIHERKEVFEDATGYVWRVEQGGQTGGYHIHFSLVLPGHLHQRDGYLAKQLGALWKIITQQRGKPHSCNANKRKYSRLGILGIGMIHRNDEAACRNAINAVGYLAEPEKEDQFLRMKPEGRRSFGTGMFERSSVTSPAPLNRDVAALDAAG